MELFNVQGEALNTFYRTTVCAYGREMHSGPCNAKFEGEVETAY